MKDIHTMTIEALGEKLGSTREALRLFRFNLSGGKTKNIREGRAHKKLIAQLLTESTARSNHK